MGPKIGRSAHMEFRGVRVCGEIRSMSARFRMFACEIKAELLGYFDHLALALE